MKFGKILSLFALIAVAALSLVASASAQQPNCLVLSSTNFPTSVSQNTFQATFNIALGSGCTVPRTVSSASITSVLGSSTSGSWAVSNTLPVTISLTSNNPYTFTATFTRSNSATGILNTNVTLVTNSSETYTFTLPAVTLTQASSNLTILPQTTPITLNQNATLIVSNSGTSDLQVTMSETSSPLFGVFFNPTSFLLSGSSQRSVIVRPGLNNIKFGLNTVSVRADAGTQTATSSFQVKKTFCASGEVAGNITIDSVDWSNNGEGEDNNWELLDEIEVEVDVSNNNNDDDEDVVVELGLFDSSGKNIADDLVFLEDSDSDNEEIEINIDDDDEETVTWVFRVPADLDKGNYKLAVKAYSDDSGENRDCSDRASSFSDGFFQSIDIEEASDEGRFVVVDEIDFDSQVTCGQTTTGQFTVFNIGEEDQDRVRILIRNEALGIDLTREITSDLDQGDDETLDFSFQIPPTANNGNYVLEFITQYDYRNGVYREESQDTFDSIFEVLGCSQNLGNGGSGGLTNIVIDARLDSEARAGKELVIVAEISNTGDDDETYSISARGYSEWADLTDVSDATISVDAGDSKEVTFTLLVNDDVSGTQSFDIQVASDGRTQIQEVEVELSSGNGFRLDMSNSLIWIIGAVNLILIILIIVVAVRLSRK